MPACGEGSSTTAFAVSHLRDRLVERHGVADTDEPLDTQLCLGKALAEVGELELLPHRSDPPKGCGPIERAVHAVEDAVEIGDVELSILAGGDGMSCPVTRTGADSR